MALGKLRLNTIGGTAIGLAATIVITIYLTWIIKKALVRNGNISRWMMLRLFLISWVLLSSLFWVMPAEAEEISTKAGSSLQLLMQNALQWVESLGAIGVVAFIGIYIVATVVFVPGTILTLGAGAVFGVVWGSVYVFVGATLGATAAFLVGRYLVRGWVAQKIAGNKKLQAIDRAVGKAGLKIGLLVRLSPAFPFILTNYAFGLTGVPLRDYVMGSVGMIPGTMMYVYLGYLTGNLALIGTAAQPTNSTLQWVLRIMGFIATVAVTIYVTRIAKKALEQEGIIEEVNSHE